jgi:hypothetical protein
MEYLGIIHYGLGIGDHLQFAALPENYYKTTGNKLIDFDNSWIFDYNPYIMRGISPTLGVFSLCRAFPNEVFRSGVERINHVFGVKTFLRHPRLYRFEENIPESKTLAVHVSGNSFGDITDKVIQQIAINYPDYKIYQIGGLRDKKTNFINKLGLSMWDTAELLSKTEIFIGLNSSMMNLAKCYPRLRKKVIITGKDLNEFIPNRNDEYWIDFNWEYYNETENDIGISNSYLKI